VMDATDTITTGGSDAGIDTLRITSNLSAFRDISAHTYFENLVFAGTGNVTLTGNGGTNQLTGNLGADTLDGGDGADTLIGGAGNDRLDGTDDIAVADSMAGGAGSDVYFVDHSGDLISEAAAGGTDSVLSQAAIYQLPDNVENMSIWFTGIGNSGANLILGNSNANVIGGNGGNDTLTGGGGMDTFVFDTAPAATYARITDFDANADDKIALNEASFDALIDGGGFNFGGLVVTNGTVAATAHAELIYTASTGALYYDADGTGVVSAKVQIAAFTTTKPAALDADDFVVFGGY